MCACGGVEVVSVITNHKSASTSLLGPAASLRSLSCL